MKNERIEYYDILKGLLIILVVLGHCWRASEPNFFKMWFYTFHMPAFFIISGILFSADKWCNKSLSSFIISRIKSLIIPYLFFEILAGIIGIFVYGHSSLNFNGVLYNTLFLYLNNPPTWFLIVLFNSEILMYLLIKYVPNYICNTIFVLSFSFLFFSPSNHFLSYGVKSIVGFTFLYTGYLLRDKANTLIHLHFDIKIFAIAALSLSISIVITIINGYVVMANNIYGNPVLYIIGVASGVLFIAFTAKFIHSNTLSYLGKNSLIIMGTHFIPMIVLKDFIDRYSNKPYFVSVVLFICIIVINIIFIPFINKYMPLLSGKPRTK